MAQVKRLIQIDFDVMENRKPGALYEKEIGAFMDGGETAHLQIGRRLEEIGPVQLYLGWDNEVYPKFEIRISEVG